MRFPNRTELERLRSEYPVGCRIVLDEMDDPYRKMPAGLQGVCRGVDDAGKRRESMTEEKRKKGEELLRLIELGSVGN